MVTSSARIAICGAASWNQLILLDRLPDPVPHMQFARGEWHTVGGTSAGKAVHLSGLGLDAELHALIGADAAGAHVVDALRRAGVAHTAYASQHTERHVNLMTADGGRVSLYVSTPSAPSDADLAAIGAALRAADIAVVDLSSMGAALLGAGLVGTIWTDLHDYDGTSAFHEPFLRAADVVFMNDDATDDAWALLQSCIDRGPRIAVCTLGARGAIALDAAGNRAEVGAQPAVVVDTNGAGDAFFSGFLGAHLRGEDMTGCLTAGAQQAVVALATHHLHPAFVL